MLMRDVEVEQELQSGHPITLRGPLSEQAAKDFRALMGVKLAAKPEILGKLVPDFPPGCRRLTPGPGYLTALTKENVDFITTGISCITEHGVVAQDGTTRPVDAIICATGFDTTWTGRFPIIGRGNRLLVEKWADYPKSYLGIATDEFPNMFMSLGPSSAVGAGSLSIVLERIGDYVCSAIQKMQREAIKTIEVKPKAVEIFYEYSQAYFPKTVFSLECSSWYKGGTKDGKVSALWPGKIVTL
jgi:cation diffusion facilitator CzcD-associated flavoprotein CzcO